jgi:hypothetical protein
MDRKEKMKRKKKAMLTVEASFVISISVIVFGIMLSLSFFVYQRCWYTQAACETVLQASSRGVLKGSDGGERAKERWEVLRSENYLVPEDLRGTVTAGKDKAEIVISGNTPVWGRKGFNLDIKADHKIIRPVNFIRKLAGLREMKESVE